MFDFFKKNKTTIIDPSNQTNQNINSDHQLSQEVSTEPAETGQVVENSQKMGVDVDTLATNSTPQNSAVHVSNQASPTANTDNETFDFVNVLVMAILGLRIEELPPDKAQEVVQECLNIFSNYIIRYVAAKYGEKDAIRLKASQQFYDDKIFTKFEDLGGKFDDAYISFVELLKSNAAVIQKI